MKCDHLIHVLFHVFLHFANLFKLLSICTKVQGISYSQPKIRESSKTRKGDFYAPGGNTSSKHQCRNSYSVNLTPKWKIEKAFMSEKRCLIHVFCTFIA